MKLMILGASSAQLSGIKRAKELGHQVVTLDYLPHAIGHSFSDEQCYTSTFDVEGVRRAGQQYCVHGIMTLGTDQPVLSASIAAESLGLPSWIRPEVAYEVTNKVAMKKTFALNQIPTTDYAIYEPGLDLTGLNHLKYPLVIKPVDSQGQRGIFYLDSLEQVIEYYPQVVKYSRQKEILVESYYPHNEVTVSGWVIDGQLTILTVTDRITFSSTSQLGVCLAHRFPSKYSKGYHEDIRQATYKIVENFNIKNGPIYFQYLIGEEGLKVNEIACRIGGAYEATFIPYITGFDIVQAQIALALGQSYDASMLKNYDYIKNPYYVSVQLFFVKPTTVAYLTDLDKLREIDGVIDIGYNIHLGDTILDIQDARQRAGYAVIIRDTEEGLDESIQQFYSTLQILDTEGENHVIYNSL